MTEQISGNQASATKPTVGNGASGPKKGSCTTEWFRDVVDGSPNSILICDIDLVIRYANPSSLKNLEKLERFLPVKASQIVRDAHRAKRS